MRFKLILFFFLYTPLFLYPQHNISVNTATVLSNTPAHAVGMNVNHLMDGSYLSPAPARSTAQALKDMNVKFLRYPGGEKADNYLWSVPPFDKPRPEVARPGSCEWPSNDTRFVNNDFKTFKSTVLDFDEFITLCNTVGAEPLIVVGYDGMYKSGSCGPVPTKAQLIETAKEWVRYANITKGYNVKYWMVGNESFMSCSYNGCATANQYRNDVIDFSIAMKAIDPTIKIIANGEKSSWWQSVLPTAATHIDYLGLSNYPVWQYTGGYGYYRTRTPDLMHVVETAVNSINQYAPASERNRLKVIVTEFGSMDWQGSWADINDLGHAIVSFEIMGEQLKHPKVETSFFWNTRWVNNATKNNDIYDALNKNGGYNANGLAHSIWGRFFMGGNMVQAASNTQIRTFANHNPATNKLNLFIINKETSSQSVNLSLNGFASNASGKRWEYKGSSVTDVSPGLSQQPNVTFTGNSISLILPATSITVLELSAPSGPSTLSPPTASNQSRCGSGTISFTASGGIAYRWYKNPTGGSVLSNNASFTTPILSDTDSFFVANVDGPNESIRTKVMAFVHPIPPVPMANDASRCGPGTVSLTASGVTNCKWFDVQSGGNPLFTGLNFTSPSLNASTTYYLESFDENCTSARNPVQANILALPGSPTAQGSEQCGPGIFTLTASGGPVLEWFGQPGGGAPLFTGPVFTTPYLSASQEFYVSAFDGKCNSQKIPAEAIVNEIPEKPEVLQIGPSTLQCSGAGLNYVWKLNGQLLPENSREIEITSNGAYSVKVEGFNACFSPRSEEYFPVLLSIENLGEDAQAKIYPNPCDGHFTIELPGQEAGSWIRAMDITGKIIHSEKLNGYKNEVYLPGHAAGIYFLLINQGEKLHTEKIIVR